MDREQQRENIHIWRVAIVMDSLAYLIGTSIDNLNNEHNTDALKLLKEQAEIIVDETDKASKNS